MSRTGNSIHRAMTCLFLVAVGFRFFNFIALAQSSGDRVVPGPWHVRHPTPTDYGRGLAHDGQKYVLVDGYGGIFTSLSGWNWTRQSAPSVPFLSSVAYGSNIFVAVGMSNILTSTNGTNWLQLPPPITSTNSLAKIIFANDQFIVVGAGGTILTSPDGLRFTQQSAPTTNWLQDITTGPGSFVTVGDQNTILVSSDSVHWIKATITNTPNGAKNHYLSGVAYFKGNYYAGPLVSSNPLSWTNNISSNVANFVGGVAATDRVIAQRGPNQRLRLSFDGRTWFTNQTVAQGNFNLIVISNLLHVVGSGRLYIGDRNNQFTPLHQERLVNTIFTNLVADTNGFFAQASGKTIFARDGKAWRTHAPSDPPLPTTEFAFASPPFARSSTSSSGIDISQDGTNWTRFSNWPTPVPRGNRLRKAVAINDAIVAVDSFNLWVTPNQSGTQAWTRLMTNTGPADLLSGGSSEVFFDPYPWITSLEVGADLVAATTSYGELLLSRDGHNWQTNQTGFGGAYTDCAITQRGVMLVNFLTIAESLFNAPPDLPTQFGFTVENRQLQFHGAMARFELQTRSTLDTSWETFETTYTNRSINIPETGDAFFRAIMPP